MKKANILWSGTAGLQKKEKALEKALELLGTEKSLTVHPDFLLMEEEAGLRMPQLEGIQEFVSLKPVEAEQKVVVIPHLQKGTPEFQNALLKLLEDSSTVFLLTAEQPVLDTIVSRCIVKNVKPMTGEQMDSYIRQNNLMSDGTAKEVAAGRPGVYEWLCRPEQKKFLEDCRVLKETLHGPKSIDQLFRKFNMFGEVRKNSFYDMHTREESALWLQYFFFVIMGLLEQAMEKKTAGREDCFSIGMLVSMAERCMEEKRKLESSLSYQKNDFFEFFRYIRNVAGI